MLINKRRRNLVSTNTNNYVVVVNENHDFTESAVKKLAVDNSQDLKPKFLDYL